MDKWRDGKDHTAKKCHLSFDTTIIYPEALPDLLKNLAITPQ